MISARSNGFGHLRLRTLRQTTPIKRPTKFRHMVRFELSHGNVEIYYLLNVFWSGWHGIYELTMH